MAVTTGVIADDFTSVTDIVSFMAQQGRRVALLPEMPDTTQCWNEEIDAIAISLKSRPLPAEQAIAQSLSHAHWLKQEIGVRQIYFRYCSTFDFTPAGNIGPVSDALMNDLRIPVIVHCPALPQNGRTVVHGHLFVNGVLLNESRIEKHPLNPVTDASLSRLLDAQTLGKVGCINLTTLRQGAGAVTDALAQPQAEGIRHVIIDTLGEADLTTLAQALHASPLLAGGFGLGGALAACTGTQQTMPPDAFPLPAKTMVFSGSCSAMSNRQVNRYEAAAVSRVLDVARCLSDTEHYTDELYAWAVTHINDPFAPMIYATQPPDILQRIQQEYGEQAANQAIEHAFSRLSAKLRVVGVNTFIVADGEISGTVVEALQVKRLPVGKAIVLGVPWVSSSGLALALKSGDFGDEDSFFTTQEYAL